MSKYVLLTGATGLVGRYLVRDLLLEGHRLALVVRPSRKQTSQDRMEAILQMWEKELGHDLPRPVLLDGDVAQSELGLTAGDRRWVASHCDRVLHNAAILTFHGLDRQGDPWRTNLHGTQNVVDLCRSLNLRDLHYVSTAYVCGSRPGMVYETELDMGQGFRNDYEESKFLAEKLVRQADFLERLTVYRPAVIAGDSRTGYTSTYHGVYMYLRMMAVLVRSLVPDAKGVRHVDMRLCLSGEELRNVVPVDWVSTVISRLFDNPRAWGGTYHLAPNEPTTPREIISAASKYLNSTGPQYVGAGTLDVASMNDFERAAYAGMAIYSAYDTTDPRFDTTNLRRFTADLPCPRIDEAMLLRFMRYGDEDRWGKRREAQPVIELSFGNHLQQTVAGRSRISQPPRSMAHKPLGIEIVGSGGGQWSLAATDQRAATITPGLPPDADVTLKLDHEAALSLSRGASSDAVRLVAQHLDVPAGRGTTEIAHWIVQTLFPSTAVEHTLLTGAINGQADMLPSSAEAAGQER
jgi:thioester reductase-like protein